MKKYQFTPQAAGDVFEIWSFVTQDNPEAADRVEEAIFRACDLLSGSPLVGTVRMDLTPLPLRVWVVHPYSKYMIVYDPEKKPLQVIRILHGARDLSSVLMYTTPDAFFVLAVSPCLPRKPSASCTLVPENQAIHRSALSSK